MLLIVCAFLVSWLIQLPILLNCRDNSASSDTSLGTLFPFSDIITMYFEVSSPIRSAFFFTISHSSSLNRTSFLCPLRLYFFFNFWTSFFNRRSSLHFRGLGAPNEPLFAGCRKADRAVRRPSGGKAGFCTYKIYGSLVIASIFHLHISLLSPYGLIIFLSGSPTILRRYKSRKMYLSDQLKITSVLVRNRIFVPKAVSPFWIISSKVFPYNVLCLQLKGTLSSLCSETFFV